MTGKCFQQMCVAVHTVYIPMGKSYFGRKDKTPIGKTVENKKEDVGGDV